MPASFGRVMKKFSSTLDYRTALTVLLLAAAGAWWLAAQTTPAVSDRARALHARSLVFDGHVHAIDRELDRKSTRLKLQSPMYLVCRLLLEKKKINQSRPNISQSPT